MKDKQNCSRCYENKIARRTKNEHFLLQVFTQTTNSQFRHCQNKKFLSVLLCWVKKIIQRQQKHRIKNIHSVRCFARASPYHIQTHFSYLTAINFPAMGRPYSVLFMPLPYRAMPWHVSLCPYKETNYKIPQRKMKWKNNGNKKYNDSAQCLGSAFFPIHFSVYFFQFYFQFHMR